MASPSMRSVSKIARADWVAGMQWKPAKQFRLPLLVLTYAVEICTAIQPHMWWFWLYGNQSPHRLLPGRWSDQVVVQYFVGPDVAYIKH